MRFAFTISLSFIIFIAIRSIASIYIFRLITIGFIKHYIKLN